MKIFQIHSGTPSCGLALLACSGESNLSRNRSLRLLENASWHVPLPFDDWLSCLHFCSSPSLLHLILFSGRNQKPWPDWTINPNRPRQTKPAKGSAPPVRLRGSSLLIVSNKLSDESIMNLFVQLILNNSEIHQLPPPLIN